MLKDSSSKTIANNDAVSTGGPVGESQIGTASLKQSPWGPLAAILYAAFLFVFAQLGMALLMALFLKGLGWNANRIEDWLTNDTFAQFAYIALAETATVAGVIWFVHRRGALMRLIGWNRFQLRYIVIALAGFGVYILGYIVTAMITSALVPSLNLGQKQDVGFQNAHTQLSLILTGISLVVLPPLAEEITFRGFLFTGLRRRFRFLPATLITSVLFAIPHLQFGGNTPLLWVAALDTLILSFVLCYVRERTNSLWPGILIHATKNGIAFIALFLIT
jgi:membrane protease YdiL (CAAX protease family)